MRAPAREDGVALAKPGKQGGDFLASEKWVFSMLYRIARFLQLGGLLILPIAIAGDVAGELTLRRSLELSGVGVTLFIIGWCLQQFAKPPS